MSATATPTTGLRNKFPGWCLDCGGRVPPGLGHLLPKEEGRRWRVRCDACMERMTEEHLSDVAAAERRDQERREAERRRREAEARRRREAAEEAERRRRYEEDPILRKLREMEEEHRRRAWERWWRQGMGSREHRPCLAILGLTPPVSADDVKAAYRRKAKETHPDHGGDAAAFNRVTSAYREAMALCGGRA